MQDRFAFLLRQQRFQGPLRLKDLPPFLLHRLAKAMQRPGEDPQAAEAPAPWMLPTPTPTPMLPTLGVPQLIHIQYTKDTPEPEHKLSNIPEVCMWPSSS